MASPRPFAHLHVHSEYSILDGACQITPLLEHVQELGMEHIGLTDHGTMAGTLELYRKARGKGVHPILGLEAYVTEDRNVRETIEGRRPKTTHLTLLATSAEGFRNLGRMSSLGFTEGYYYRPRIDYEVMAAHSDGIIALTGCMASQTQRHLADGRVDDAMGEVDRLLQIFGRDNVYVEWQDAGIDEQKRINELLAGVARDLALPSVVTADVHYLRHGDAVPHDALLCIQTKAKLSDAERFRFSTDQFYVKSPDEMYEQFASVPEEWLRASVEIAERCQVDLNLGETLLPPFPTPNGEHADEYLHTLCQAGLRRRYDTLTGELEERLRFELDTISKMGYSAYFLITWDWINWAKEQGIAVGPGRGSAAGSLVAYVLGITDVDPLRYDLLFERFLNPDRVSMPDIDTDVSQAGRERCIQYLAERYGRDHVAQIATFGRMQPKAALRDAARVMDYPPAIGDKVAKLVPDGPGISFEQVMAKGQDLRKEYDADETVRKIVDMARPLEGVVRNSSIHAAAVVIGDRPLTDVVPLRMGDKGEIVTQFAQDDVEALGLLKMDVLGLRNLDVLEHVRRVIHESRGVDIDPAKIPLDDAPTYEMVARGDNLGVFQLESPGMSGAARQIRPTRFEDLVALVAMFRPGPMAYIPIYAANKRDPSKVTYEDERLKDILDETYGITCYQEQYMLIARRLAGFTPGEADDLRKGIAKKKRDVLDRIKPKFLEGCATHEVDGRLAAKLWEDMERAGDYSFNKSHSVCYALIAYQTAYLKCHYPAEYMAALISTVMHTKDRVPFYISGCASMGLEVLPPDVNESFRDFTVVDGNLRFGLSAVKGVGDGAVAAIVSQREEGGAYTSIWDFCERVDLQQVNKRVLEALIKAGALDSTGASRKSMLEVAAQALSLGQKTQADAAAGQFDLFGDMGGDNGAVESAKSYPNLSAEEYSKDDILRLEKEATGLYISGHPLQEVAERLRQSIDHRIVSLEQCSDRQEVVIGGLVTAVRQLTTRKGDPMAFMQVEDLEGSIRVVVLPKVYEAAREAMMMGDPPIVIVRGKVDRRDEGLDMVADQVMRLQDAPRLNTVALSIAEELLDDQRVGEMARILRNYPGDAQVEITVQTATGPRTLRTGQQWRVDPGNGLYAELRSVFGDAVITA